MYSLCKKMLDGLGPGELASCAGLSKSQVVNIVSHSYARNNRAVLFNLASSQIRASCSMIIHITDMLVLEDEYVAKQVSIMHSSSSRKNVTADSDVIGVKDCRPVSNISRDPNLFPSNPCVTYGILYRETTDIVSADAIATGNLIREKVEKIFNHGPNGKHFIHTVLLSCLLPTVGFHVLSRTSHTDLMEAFWFRHIPILHSSNHLKYQELSLFSLFFRLVMPTVVPEHLYAQKPGKAVLKLLSFTGSDRDGIDKRGWTYVHHCELLEMLAVRHLKSLSVNFINHLQNAAAWLLPVSMSRALIRYTNGASRSFGRKGDPGDGGELPGPLSKYDRNACQWKAVARMVHIMRECLFLNIVHRGSEQLTNVFSTPPKVMNIKKYQEEIPEVSKRGAVTAKLHASVLYPEIFRGLTEEDKSKYFSGKRFKKWTRV